MIVYWKDKQKTNSYFDDCMDKKSMWVYFNQEGSRFHFHIDVIKYGIKYLNIFLCVTLIHTFI